MIKCQSFGHIRQKILRCIIKLEHFFSSDGFLTDRDMDGVFDGIKGHIVLNHGCSQDEKLAALNMLARLSFECAAMPLDSIVFSHPAAGDLFIFSSGDLPEGTARLSLRDEVYWLEFSTAESSGMDYFIMRMPYLNVIGKTVLNDLRPSLLGEDEIVEIKARREGVTEICLRTGTGRRSFKVEPVEASDLVSGAALPEACTTTQGEIGKIEICDLFSVRGFYTDPENGLLNDRTDYSLMIGDSLSEQAVIAAGNIVSRLCVECFSLKSGIVRQTRPEDGKPCISIIEKPGGTACLHQIENSIELSGSPEALLSFSQQLAGKYPYIDENGFHSLRDIIVQLEDFASGRIAVQTQAKSEYEGKIIWEDSRILPSELEDFHTKMAAFCDGLSTGDKVEIYALLDKDRQTRAMLTGELAASVQRRGAELSSCKLLCAYKQGFSWLSESVAPRLKGLELESIIIRYSPFFHKKIRDWSTYDGEIPPFSVSDPDWLDLPIRFFNELYPIDDLLAETLGIHRDRITFEAAKLPTTYSVECRNSAGDCVFTEDFTVCLRKRPYMEDFPELGPVWVNTGRLQIAVNGKIKMDEIITTDLERVWEYGQRYMFHKAGLLLADMQEKGRPPVPVFREIVLECSLCAVDEKLPYRTDTVSSLETLHEDIHFVGLEFFKHLGKKLFRQEITAPGLILPVIRGKKAGPPEVRAYIIADDEPCLKAAENTGKPTETLRKLRVCELLWSEGGPALLLKTDDIETEMNIKRYAGLLKNGIIRDTISNSGWTFTISCPGDDIVIHTNKTGPKPKKGLNPDILDTSELVTYSRYLQAMENISKVQGLNTFVIAKSYMGRPIYAVELMDYSLNSIVSRCKLINAKPSYLLNNRHHANEVSSTGMIFELIKNLLKNPDWQVYRRLIHISMIPFANVDGGALHERLQLDNPGWMLHAARFNAVGMETRPLYFNDTTQYTEATALPKLWRLCLPDIIADNHGIPNHECNFPAFGGNRIELRSNWLPCAQFFGYLTYIDDPRYNVNHIINNRIRDSVASAINADPKIIALNNEWRDRYEKYAHSVMPDLFKANYYKGIIFHEKRQKLNSDFRNISLRYPDITVMDWITEVADETATGDNLQTCIKTHLIACRATMDAILSLGVHPENRDQEDNNGILLWRRRSRPLKL